MAASRKQVKNVRRVISLSTGAVHTSTIAVRYSMARRAFDSDSALANALEINRSQVARWKRGGSADPENAVRLLGLDVVVSLLDDFLEPVSIPKWIHGNNAHLGNRRPIDVLMHGRLSEVIRAIEAEKSGAFA